VVGAGVVVSLEEYLSDRVGSWATVVIGGIFVICVIAFRRGIVGEIERRHLRPPTASRDS
jgi:branched-chain amino acid transport system permease protein